MDRYREITKFGGGFYLFCFIFCLFVCLTWLCFFFQHSVFNILFIYFCNLTTVSPPSSPTSLPYIPTLPSPIHPSALLLIGRQHSQNILHQFEAWTKVSFVIMSRNRMKSITMVQRFCNSKIKLLSEQPFLVRDDDIIDKSWRTRILTHKIL